MSTDPAQPVRKFMFDRPFDAGAAVRPPERKPVTLKPEQVDAFKKESYDAGFAAGQQAGHDAQQQQIHATLVQIDGRLTQMIGAMHVFQAQQDAHMRQLAVAIARKILPQFVARHGEQEIESLVATAMAEMPREPRLVVRVAATQLEMLEKKIQEIAAQKAYAGSVVVVSDASVADGDCRIEWADGGIERNAAATLDAIEAVVAPEDSSLSQE